MPQVEKPESTGEEMAAVNVGRARKTGDIDAVKRIDYLVLRTAYRRMKAAKTFDQQGKAIYEAIRASENYKKTLEQVDMHAELAQVKEELAAMKREAGLKKVA